MSYGQGRVFKRKKIWWISFYIHGKERRESARTEDRQTAIDLLKARTFQPDRAVKEARQITVSDLLDGLETHYQVNGYRSIRETRCHIKPVRVILGRFFARDLTSEHVISYVSQRQTANKANATINRELATLRRAFALAVKNQTVTSAPNIDALREDNAREGFFTREEIQGVMAGLQALDRPDLADLSHWAYCTGMRRGEAVKLTWRGLDLETRTLRLKGKNGSRILPLTGEVWEIIQRRIACRHREIPWIFHYRGKQIGQFRKTWASVCKLAGCPGRLFHDLRRTGIRNLIRAGVSRTTAMAISGHRTDEVFRRYDIVTEEDLRDAFKRLDDHQIEP